ncbi:MAG: hypothetical protein VCE74_12860 [Alphaproteobacteria bacterium]
MEAILEKILRREIPHCRALISAERLSGGASQETYRLTISDQGGVERPLAMRRAPGARLTPTTPTIPAWRPRRC